MTAQPFFVPAALILLVAVPLALGLVPRNRLYGVRTTKTLADARVWERANRFGGLALAAAGGLSLVVAGAGPSAASGGAAWALQLGAFVLPLALGVPATARYLKRL